MRSLQRTFSLLLAGSMLLPLIALADGSSSSSSSSNSSSFSSGISSSSTSSRSSVRDDREGKGKRKNVQPIVAGCVQAAVDARETAVLAALTTYTNGVIAAFQVKKTGLHDAWAMSDAAQRKASIKTVWTTFAQSKKSARKAYQVARKTAWSNFKQSAKTCKESMSDEMYGAHEDL